jgi:exonuclease VII small subunit
MSARGNGGHSTYYACTGRQKYGPKACDNHRLPAGKLEQAVISQLTGLYRDGGLVEKALADARHEAEQRQPEIERRLAAIGAETIRGDQALERYYQAFEEGKLSPERCDARLARLQTRLDDLHAQHAELSLSTTHEGTPAPTAADLAAIADQLERVLGEGEPQKSKALIRELVAELRVNIKAEILPSYYLDAAPVWATSEKVDLTGLLSNFETEALYKRLTERDWQQVARVQRKPRDRSRDGKLRFGTVSGAVLEVLAQTEGSMRFIEIHREVEALLGFEVLKGSVKQCLSAEASHRRPRFTRVGHGRYQSV